MRSAKEYIQFADPVVEAICVANWSSDGVGLTKDDAAAVTSIGTVFKENTSITSFDELELFGLTSFSSQAFMGCTALTSIAFPATVSRISQQICKNCISLSRVKFNAPMNFTASGCFDNCPNLSRVDVPSLGDWFGMMRFEKYPFNRGIFGDIYIAGQKLVVLDLTTITDIPAESFSRTSLQTAAPFSAQLSVGNDAFSFSKLCGTIVIPSGMSLGRYAFAGCSQLTDFYLHDITQRSLESIQEGNTAGMGNGTGVFYCSGRIVTTENRATRLLNFKHLLFGDDFEYTPSDNYAIVSDTADTMRVQGDITTSAYIISSSSLKLLEVMGVLIGTSRGLCSGLAAPLLHLGYSGVACSGAIVSALASQFTKIYVGSGESQAADQAVLNQYLADLDWAQYSSKLDLWYNYNGEYKNWPNIPTA